MMFHFHSDFNIKPGCKLFFFRNVKCFSIYFTLKQKFTTTAALS